MRNANSQALILLANCQGCGGPLKHIGNLRSIGLPEAIHVFACEQCKIVLRPAILIGARCPWPKFEIGPNSIRWRRRLKRRCSR